MTFQSSNQPQEPRAQIDLRSMAQLFKLKVMSTFDAWNADKPMRTGFPHASNILAPESEFCLRKLVMMAVYPSQAERPPVKPWNPLENARFKNGWVLHEKYQDLLKRYGRVIYTNGEPELDRTHFDETRLLYFSPDAIIDHYGTTMVVEIKGYKDGLGKDTANKSTFDKLDELGTPPEAAHCQVNFYLHLLELDYGLVLVECKNTQELKVWCVEYDRELAQPYIDRMYHFKAAYLGVKAGRKPLPVRKCEKSTDRLAEKCEMCRYCFSLKD